jgi:AcrR family transcriptional regulator
MRISQEASRARRDQLLDAAVDEIVDRGFADAAVTRVAARCGVAATAIYNRFDGRDGLVAAVLDERLRPAMVDVEASDAAVWAGPPMVPLAPRTMALLAEAHLGARHDAAVGATVRALHRDRLEASLTAARAASLREGQDDVAIALLGMAVPIGRHLLALAAGTPVDPSISAYELIALAARDEPADVPLTATQPSTYAWLGNPDDDESLDGIGVDMVRVMALLLAENGYDQAKPADVVRRSGASLGALYQRFGSKAGLMAALVRWTFGAADALIREAGSALADPRPTDGGARLGALFDRSFWGTDLAVDRALRIEVLATSRREPLVGAAVLDRFAVTMRELQRVFAEEVAEGRFRPDVDAAGLATWGAAIVMGLSVLGEVHEGPAPVWSPTLTNLVRVVQTRPRA